MYHKRNVKNMIENLKYECIMVGSDSKVYLLFDPKNKSIIIGGDGGILKPTKERKHREQFYYSEILQSELVANPGEGKKVVKVTPEVVATSGNNLSTEDESDDDDGDYFDYHAWASHLPSPIKNCEFVRRQKYYHGHEYMSIQSYC